jgi:CubicO group peptidase (beta-lactamase class C family)
MVIFKHAIFAALLAVSSFGSISAGAQQLDATTWPTKAWQSSTPEQQGMDSRALANLVASASVFTQDSLLVIRHGTIVVDAYRAPYFAGIRHDLRSVTKSVMSTLIGVLVQQGTLDSTERPLLDFFPDTTIANLDDRKKAITVQHLLDMTSGFDWFEWTYTPVETIMEMYNNANPTEFVLGRPMADVPGTRFNYKAGDPYLLSALTNRLTGQNALEFARRELFAPLGIDDVRWAPIDKQGVVTGEAGLFLTPHDMAKLGHLYLRDGVWGGKRIIPSAWVERVKQGSMAVTGPEGMTGRYANLWWSFPEARKSWRSWRASPSAYAALGRHGQVILVLPKLDIVAVLTGAVEHSDQYYPLSELIERITEAVKSDSALPPDAEGEAQLVTSVRDAATEKPTPVSPVPELAQVSSGKTWRFANNALKVRTLKLNLMDVDPTFELSVYPEESNRADTILSEPIGLDGRFRTKHQDFAVVANKGAWVDDATFTLERRVLGHGEVFHWTFRFDGDKLKFTFRSTDGWSVKLDGEPLN